VDEQSKFITADVLAVSCAIHTEMNGYLSKPDSMRLMLAQDPAYRASNSELLYAHFFQGPQVVVNPEHTILADQVTTYIKGLAFKTFQRRLSDYEKSLLLTVNTQALSASQLGITAAMPNMYFESIRSDAWNQREADLAPNTEFYGEPGQSLDLECKLEYWKVIPRTHSTFMIVSVDDRFVLKFFLSSKIIKPVRESNNLRVMATVKAHTLSEHSDAKITQVHYVSVLT
jgi:hypothetical protein